MERMCKEFEVLSLHLLSVIKKENNKFWEVILVSDLTSRKKALVCVHNEVTVTTEFVSLQC
jgi:hypothetical protein